MKPVPGPLNGYVGIECASYMAGPVATKFLADMGMRVIRIEPVTGDPSRTFPAIYGPDCPLTDNVMDVTLHGNKEDISLDLKTEEGQKILHQMCEKADVFLTNYTLHTLKNLHITYDELHTLNPRLICAYVSGLGEKGKDAGRPGFDITSYWSRGGTFAQMGDPGSEPMAILTGQGDNPTGMAVTIGIIAALLDREKTGKGCKVTGSLYATAIWINNLELCASNYVKINRGSRRLPKSAFTNTYCGSDGLWFTIALLQPPQQFPVLCEALGNPDLAKDPRFKDTKSMYDNRAELVEEIEKMFSKYTRPEIEKILTAARLPYEVHQTFDDILHDQQALDNEYLVPVEYPYGTVLSPTIPVKIDRYGTTTANNKAVAQGAQTVKILKDLGYSDAEIAEMEADKIIVAAHEA